MAKQLISTKFENRSGIELPGNALKIIKQNCFIPLDVSVGGDAPKDVIKMYIYDGKIRKNVKKSWPTYIAKIGHKWYPNESITEQLITDIGGIFGIKIAHSELVQIEEMVRFCSRHFHSKDQLLNHGAEILSIYLEETDNDWIEELDRKNEIKEFINIQDIINALNASFESNIEEITFDLVNMILFDALVGNNDRHYFNWGIITHLEGKHLPFFAPIFDTARGLWWNISDKFILSLQQDKSFRQRKINKYIKNSVPKIGIPEDNKCNHFQLVEYLRENGFISSEHVQIWGDSTKLRKLFNHIDSKFCKLMVKERREIIKDTIELRFNYINNII